MYIYNMDCGREILYNVYFYIDENQNCPLDDFISGLKSSNKEKVYAWISKLEEKGPLLPRPYADFLRDGIHELRIKLSGEQIRVLYFFIFQESIILTHHFEKNTDKVPNKEIEKAIAIKTEFESRFKTIDEYYDYSKNL